MFKVGDKVIVKNDLIMDDGYCGSAFINVVKKCEGNEYAINKVLDSGNYLLEGCGGWIFMSDMLEPAPFTTADLQNGMVCELRNGERYMWIDGILVGEADRKGLKQGIFPWGYAIHTSENHWVYFINANRFAEIEGVKL